MVHKCKYEEKIKDLEKAVFGNGQPGLKDRYIRLDTNVEALTESSDKLATTVSALVRFMSEIKGAHKMRTTISWLIGIIITLGLAYIGTVLTIAVK